MKLVGRARKSRALHVRFRRGYQFAFVAVLVMGAGVWISARQGLDDLKQADDAQILASTVRSDIDVVSSALSRLDNSPDSPVLLSDLQRYSTTLLDSWRTLSGDITTMPPEVRVLFTGDRGIEADLTDFVSKSRALAFSKENGGLGSGRSVEVEARLLQADATELSERFGQVVASYDAREKQAVNGLRTLSNFSYLAAFLFLVVLIIGLLRPLERQLRVEHQALLDAGESHRIEANRQELTGHLAEGLDAAETESEAMMVVSRAFTKVADSHPVEMLLADQARSRLQAKASNSDADTPGCGVQSPSECPAITRGRTIRYEDSNAINACPMLVDRAVGRCSAVCVPLSFMGQSMGVIHAVGGIDNPIDKEIGNELSMIATHAAVRIGTIRSFAKIELQASTDLLTGLPNRRATEDRVERMIAGHEVGSVAMADLDQFKILNDTYGHEAGDRALRLFADAVSESLREEDWVGRWGGEEFVIVLPGLVGDRAVDALDRVRVHLAESCMRAEAPTVRVSVGVVDTESADSSGEILRLADEALLVAKTQGRDRVVLGPVVNQLEDSVLEGTEQI